MKLRHLLQLLLPLVVLAMVPLALAEPPVTGVAGSSTAASARPAIGSAHGLAPMPDDQRVPPSMLPPGSFDPDTGPSTVVYPIQNLTLRFNHKYHVVSEGLDCATCHEGAKTSRSVNDKLTPAGTACDSCHGTSHDDLAKVSPGDDAKGQCGFCHVGWKQGDTTVARFVLPRANMIFDHKKHVTRNIGCPQCHGDVKNLELATRDQLPRMKGCFGCHQMSDAAWRGEAKAACETCHVRGSGSQAGRMKTMFASGTMKPPRWLHNAQHTPDFIQRHKYVAGNDSQFCANCHSENYCTDCHDGRVRPRTIHPNDYISMHPIEARQETQRCTSCHREQSFCVDCHLRVGVAMSSPSGVRNSGRFHPAKAIWSDAPRKPGHHALEAERNLNACVSCHIERDCVSCHGGQGIGGGFNPHRAGFANGCGTQLRRNPRPCFVCHQPGAAVLSQCR